MKAILSIENLASTLVTTWWTPVFMLAFFAILAYALWPKNKQAFDEAARVPLRDVWYDGVDSNCDGADDFDQDGDGYTNLEKYLNSLVGEYSLAGKK